MRSLAYVLISLCLVGCVSKKDKLKHNVTALVSEREDVGQLAVTDSAPKGSLDIQVPKDLKLPEADRAARSTANIDLSKTSKYAEQREVEKNKQIDPRTPAVKSRHDKMMQQTSPVFADPNEVGSLSYRTKSLKK